MKLAYSQPFSFISLLLFLFKAHLEANYYYFVYSRIVYWIFHSLHSRTQILYTFCSLTFGTELLKNIFEHSRILNTILPIVFLLNEVHLLWGSRGPNVLGDVLWTYMNQWTGGSNPLYDFYLSNSTLFLSLSLFFRLSINKAIKTIYYN